MLLSNLFGTTTSLGVGDTNRANPRSYEILLKFVVVCRSFAAQSTIFCARLRIWKLIVYSSFAVIQNTAR